MADTAGEEEASEAVGMAEEAEEEEEEAAVGVVGVVNSQCWVISQEAGQGLQAAPRLREASEVTARDST